MRTGFEGWLCSVRSRKVELPNGSRVLIRQVRKSDAALLAEGFARLSPRSRQMRFLTNKQVLTDSELRYLTDVDHRNHEALGALSEGATAGVGIARYIRDTDDPESAEIAITIADDWQSLGLGSILLTRLSDRARKAGIHRFTALVSIHNDAVAWLLRKAGGTRTRRDSDETDEYEISLTATSELGLDAWSWALADEIALTLR